MTVLAIPITECMQAGCASHSLFRDVLELEKCLIMPQEILFTHTHLFREVLEDARKTLQQLWAAVQLERGQVVVQEGLAYHRGIQLCRKGMCVCVCVFVCVCVCVCV